MSISSVVTSGGDDIIAAIGLITPIVESFQHCLIVIEVNKLTCGIFTLIFFLPSNNEISTSITPKRGSVVFHVCSSPIITWKCRNLFCVSMTKYKIQKKPTKNTYNNNIHKGNYWCVWKLDTKKTTQQVVLMIVLSLQTVK